MSSKINVLAIVHGHFDTLRDEASRKTSTIDLLVFYGVPLAIAAIGIYFGFNLKEKLTELLVNFGSILTALLLSVLVLVYDQEAKIRSETGSSQTRLALQAIKKKLLRQLYFNICYAIILSVVLALICFIHSSMPEGAAFSVDIPFTAYVVELMFGPYFTTPIALVLAINVVLTVLMIVKRLHVLLTSE